MFIRSYINTTNKSGKPYNYFAIVESERVGNAIIQKTVLNLGTDFDLPKEKWKMLIEKIKKYINGQQTLFETTFNTQYDILARNLANQIVAKRLEKVELDKQSIDNDIIKVKKSKVDCEDYRSVGAEHVALNGTERIGLFDVFKSLNIGEDKAKIGVATVVARMIHPASERETFRWLSVDSSLREILGIDLNSENCLHRISDILCESKEIIESKIYNNINNLLHTCSTVRFYDLTNTYFEGDPKADKAKRGHSKEKRTDCSLVTLALVIDSFGFVIRSETFPGNVSEPATLKDMLAKLKATNVGKVVMDRGIATADNIKWLNENKYTYLVVNRENKRIFDFTKATTIKTKSNSEVYVYKEITEEGTEARIYCYSENRGLKESAIWAKKDEQFIAELKKINDGLHKKRCQKDKNLIERRIGRLFEKWSGIAQHYKVTVEDNSNTKTQKERLLATNIIWEKNIVAGSMMEQPGVYCIKSNDLSMSAEVMWHTYTQLTDIEAVFRSLKSELGLRPIYHQKEQRIESHLFITVLAYQCVQMIRMILKKSGINDSWWTIRNNLANHGRLTILLPDDNGGCETIRKSIKPNDWQINIYRALRITTRPGEIVAKKI